MSPPIEQQPNREYHEQGQQWKNDSHHPPLGLPRLLQSGVFLLLLQIFLKQTRETPLVGLGAKLGWRVLGHKTGILASLVRLASVLVDLAQIVGTLRLEKEARRLIEDPIQIDNR